MTRFVENFPDRMTKICSHIHADVVVVGAGVSGVPAAVAAARAGAKTLLIEKRSAPGGTMSASLGFPVCGLFEATPDAAPRLLNCGLTEELYSIVSRDVSEPVAAMGRVTICNCPLPLFESITSRWLEHENLTAFFGISEWSLGVENDRIQSFAFQTSDHMAYSCNPAQVIDCTGSGDVVRKSGAEQIVPDQLPLAGFSAELKNIAEDDMLSIRVPYVLRRAAEAGRLPAFCARTVITPLEQGRALCKFNLPESTPKADAELAVQDSLHVLKQELPAFVNASLLRCSPSILRREGSRMKGRVVLSADDIRTGRSFEDSVARGAWPMEYWDAESGPQYEYVEKAYDIPRRALRSENIENLWAAGRLISADSAALASLRVMGTAMATGEAAGRAAAGESL